VVTRRYEAKSTVLTTNKPFAEWSAVFEGSACVVSLVDRLVHRAEIVQIEGESYRLKEARERAAAKTRQRKQRKTS
jgi:DNA replication protein DnaC